MGCFEKMLLTYLRDGKLEMKITGFDMEGFQKAANEERKRRLEMIEYIAFEDTKPDSQKIEAIKMCFQKDFYL